jgi:hypothetical protein
VPFFSMSAAVFVEMIVGVGAARVRDPFNQAREHAPWPGAGRDLQAPADRPHNYPETYLRAHRRHAGRARGRGGGLRHAHRRCSASPTSTMPTRFDCCGSTRRALDALVNALLERETLGELEILETTGLPPAPAL